MRCRTRTTFSWLLPACACALIAFLTSGTSIATEYRGQPGASQHDSPAPMDSGPKDCGKESGFFCSPDGYIYIFDETKHAWQPVPRALAHTPPEGPETQYEWALTPACQGAKPDSPMDCDAAEQFCAANGKSGLHEYIWRSEIEPEALGPTVVGDVCASDLPAPISVGQAGTDVHEFEQDHMPIPVPNVQPRSWTLVNLPVIVSVADVGEQTMNVTEPVPGQLVATPTYTWTFDHDDSSTLMGTGIAYDGTDPRRDPTHYLTHTFRAVESNASVTLTVKWNATFTAAGYTMTLPQLVMPPIVTTFPVYEAHSVLVGS